MSKSNRFSPEVRERAVRMVGESRADHPSHWATIESIAAKMGCAPQTLHDWVRRHETDTGQRPGITTAHHQRIVLMQGDGCQRGIVRRVSYLIFHTLFGILIQSAQRGAIWKP